MLAAMPASPISGPVIEWTGKIDLMASITPILAFAGVLLGKDWKAFLNIGWKGILVSVLTIFGTFFLSGWIAEVLGIFYICFVFPRTFDYFSLYIAFLRRNIIDCPRTICADGISFNHCVCPLLIFS